MEITLYYYDEEKQTIVVTRKFEQDLLHIDYNKSSKSCDPCALEYKKINKKVNNKREKQI